MILRTKKDSKEWTEKDKGKEVASPERDPRQGGKQPGPPRTAQRIPLPHNSMFVLGEATNRKWLHAIKQDKRLPTLLSAEEASNGGERISLTFRHIGTFLTDSETKIWGQGATGKTREEAKPVFENNQQEVDRMIFAFGTENHQAEEFDWDGVYGAGYDVLHFRNRQPKLFYRSQRSIGTTRVLLALSEKGVDVEVEESERRAESQDDELVDGDDISLADCDIDRTTMKGSIPILLYLESFYTGEKALGGIGKPLLPKPERHERGAYAQVLGLLLESERLREAVEAYRKATSTNPPTSSSSSSSTQATKSADISSSQTTTSAPGESAPSPPPATPTKAHLQNTLDHFESQLYRISLGSSGKALGLTKGEEDVCFGGIGTSKCWSVADCAIWPVLRRLEKLRPDGGFWAELGGDDRWPLLGNYIKRGWERPRVRRVFMGTDKQSDVKEENKEVEKITEGDEEKGDKKESTKPRVDAEGVEAKSRENLQPQKAKEGKSTEEQREKGDPEAKIAEKKQLEVRPAKKVVEEKPVGKVSTEESKTVEGKLTAAEGESVAAEGRSAAAEGESAAAEEKPTAAEERSAAAEGESAAAEERLAVAEGESVAAEERSAAAEGESAAAEERPTAAEERPGAAEGEPAAAEEKSMIREKSVVTEEKLTVTDDGLIIEEEPTEEKGLVVGKGEDA